MAASREVPAVRRRLDPHGIKPKRAGIAVQATCQILSAELLADVMLSLTCANSGDRA